MSIGVARPSAAELAAVPHYFIASHSIHEEVSAASFEQYALDAVGEIFSKSDVAIMVGGTGLYIKAFCEGLDPIPPIDPTIRQQVINDYETYGLPWLQQQVKEKDPVYFSDGEIQNPQRLMRALEVTIATGQSIRHYQRSSITERNFRIIRIGLDLPREQLYTQIDHRVDQMIKEGLIEEVKALYAFRHLVALQTVGYKELFDYLDHQCSLGEAIASIKQHTRHYAKRQLTWFRKAGINAWFDPRKSIEILRYVEEALQ